MSDNLPPKPTSSTEADTPNSVINISGGVAVDAHVKIHWKFSKQDARRVFAKYYPASSNC